MTFVQLQEYGFFANERYFWLCSNLKISEWEWVYNPVFGVAFVHEADATLFKLKFA